MTSELELDIKLQFRHRLDDSLKHRSLADLIGGPEGSGIWLWPNLSSSATENAKSEVGLLYELARMFCCNLTWIQLPPSSKRFSATGASMIAF